MLDEIIKYVRMFLVRFTSESVVGINFHFEFVNVFCGEWKISHMAIASTTIAAIKISRGAVIDDNCLKIA